MCGIVGVLSFKESPFQVTESYLVRMRDAMSHRGPDGVLKYILKRAVRGIIPDEIIDRQKQGFGVPVYEWLFSKLGSRIQQELTRFCRETQFFDHGEIMRRINGKMGPQMWYLLNFVLWWREFIVGRDGHGN